MTDYSASDLVNSDLIEALSYVNKFKNVPSSLRKKIIELNAQFGIYDETSASEYLKNSQTYEMAKLGFSLASAVGSGMDATSYRKQIQNTKTQYETEKKILDTNLKNTESLLAERLQENISDIRTVTAAKNVDIRSGGIQTLVDKGASDMNADINTMQTQNSLQKAAMDLQYKLNVSRAKQAETNAWASSIIKIGMAGADYLYGL